MATKKLNLFPAFLNFDDAQHFFSHLTNILAPGDPAIITFLALEGMRHIEEQVERRQFSFDADTVACINFVMKKCHNNLCQPSYEPVYTKWLDFYGQYFDLNLPKPIPQADLNSGKDFLSADMAMKYKVFDSLVQAGQADPLVAVLALQGLHCIGYNFEPDKMVLHRESGISYWCVFRTLLEVWRCNSHVDYVKMQYLLSELIPKVSKALTIFTVLEVPLLIDDYGDKCTLAMYSSSIVEPILINVLTPIAHVTHYWEMTQIESQKKFLPSDNKNSISGVWFGICTGLRSVYGSHAFQTTLSALGVGGLAQGEIIRYKNEVQNVILYAVGDPREATPLMKPSQAALKRKYGRDAHVSISIFVPARFLHAPVNPSIKIGHGPFCAKEKRTGVKCAELPFKLFYEY